MIILGMLLAGCGNHTAAESTEMPGRMDISSQEKNILMAAPADLGAIRQIRFYGKSVMEYYCATEPASFGGTVKADKAHARSQPDYWYG